jgi:outer membrane protein assembly factor BamD (BamD/ComL family)
MGGKPHRARQYIYFCLAILVFVSACSLLPESARRRELRELMARGNSALAKSEFRASLRAFENVLEMTQDQPPADAAIYGVGLVYVHPKNPERDRQQAIASFNRVINKFPQSAWAAPAQIWIDVLNEAERSKREIEKSKQVIEKSRYEIEKNRLAVEESKHEIEKARLELEKSKQEIEKSKQMIEKSRQVDMEIEQKRRARRK